MESRLKKYEEEKQKAEEGTQAVCSNQHPASSIIFLLEMRRDLEAAAELEAKLKQADEEAKALKEEQQRIEEEKAKMAAIAAKQKQQSEDEVGF